MIATTVSIRVKKNCIDEFIAATIKNHLGTVKEKGNIRFDFLQSHEDESSFLLYEVFESKEAIELHKLTPHYLKWKETVAEYMEVPRVGIAHRVLAPVGKDLW